MPTITPLVPLTVIATWVRSLPLIETELPASIREARSLLRDLDDTRWPRMDAMLHQHGYDELHIALEARLSAIDPTSSRPTLRRSRTSRHSGPTIEDPGVGTLGTPEL